MSRKRERIRPTEPWNGGGGLSDGHRPRTHLDPIVAANCVVLVLSNVAATQGVAFGAVITDGRLFLFPPAHVLGDVVAEICGFRAARRAIVTSFAAGLFASVAFWLDIALPPAEFCDGRAAFESVLGPVALIVAGSLPGHLAVELVDTVIGWLKRREPACGKPDLAGEAPAHGS